MSTASPTPKWVKVLSTIVSVVAALVAILVFIGRNAQLGSAYKVSDKETVRYAGNATEDEAKRVADVLREIGFFDGSKVKDVIVRKEDNQTPSVSIVVGGTWDTPDILAGFKELGGMLAN